MTLDTTGVVNAPADLFKAVDAFEDAVQPAYGVNFTEFSRSRPIRWDLVTPGRGETLAPEASRRANRRNPAEDRRRHSPSGLREAEESRASSSSSRASRACRTTRFRTRT